MSLPPLTKELLTSEYSSYKKQAYDYFDKDQFSKSLKCIEYCGLMAWFTPIIEQFCDVELEILMKNIKRKHHSIKFTFEGKENRVVFYNSQIVDSGALTEQYLNYFIQKKYEVLFIVPDIKNTSLGQGILRTIEENQLITLFVPENADSLEKIKLIEKEIALFSPEFAFLHFTPADVVGFASFCDFDKIKKYYIVHNDHTFWFGITCSDYFIEFRKFGYLLAIERRGIDSSKIFHLPYYPIIQKKSFQGFPFDTKGKIIGFSGANLYKYYFDPELKYFYAIKELLLQNENFIFCLAGYGNTELVEQFIAKNHLQDRFYFLGKRNDFYELVNNIDILFESYPFKGGLTVLYGVENHKAITGIGENRNPSGCIEDFFDIPIYKQPQNFEDFISEADQLIKSKTAREVNVAKFSCSKYNETDFEFGLNAIMSGFLPGKNPIYKESLQLDDEHYITEYIEIPDAEYNFYFRKLYELKSIISMKEKFSILFHLYNIKPQLIKRRIFRLLFLVILGN